MRSGIRLGLGLVVAPFLAACPGEGGGDSAAGGICRTLGNSSHVAWSSSPSSAFANPTLAFDGHLASYAELSPPDGATGSISGGGLSRPAGDFAGIAFTRPASGAITVHVSLYRGGALVGSGQAGSTRYSATGADRACPGFCIEGDGLVFYGIQAPMSYDTIKANVSLSGLGGPLQIRELCVVD